MVNKYLPIFIFSQIDYNYECIFFKIMYSICILGVCAYALSVVLGITSLPSVTNVLTWKEFAFVQSKLGWLCLVFGSAHELFFSWPHLLSYHCSFFLHGSMVNT